MARREATEISNTNIDGLISPQQGWSVVITEAQQTLGKVLVNSVVNKGSRTPEELGRLDVALLEAAGFTPEEDLPNSHR
jgi:hypothetical protein